ncbi:MAG: DUF5060 domain-containing protein [Planctomycetota bacterium]|jgi:hypothetical protein
MNAELLYRLTGAACLIAVSAAGGPASLMAADLGTIQGTQWSPYLQWTVVNPTSSGNAFDVRATVEFTHHPSGETRRTEMFFVGGRSWAFRFTGTRLGTWSFVTSSEDEDLRGHTGKVMIAPNHRVDVHGFLEKSGSKWGWEATENVFVPQLVMWDYIAGGNIPRVSHNKPELVDRKIEQFIVDHGFNGFHVPVIGGRWFDLDATSDRVESAMTDPDPRTFEALELLITKTHEAGGLVHIWPWGDHSRRQTPKSLTGGIGGVSQLSRDADTRILPRPRRPCWLRRSPRPVIRCTGPWQAPGKPLLHVARRTRRNCPSPTSGKGRVSRELQLGNARPGSSASKRHYHRSDDPSLVECAEQYGTAGAGRGL